MSAAADIARALVEDFEHDWHAQARPEQLPPPGAWLTWLILSGRGWGKTRVGAEWVRSIVCGPTPLASGRYRRIALVAETAADARDVMVEGPSGLLAIHPKDFRPVYESSKRRVTWPNGAIATLYNATEPDQLRGPEHEAAWADEMAKWAQVQETWDMLQFGLRIGPQPRTVITTTPRPLPVLRQIMGDAGTVVTRGRTLDNADNLSPAFLKKITDRYAGTRLGRQELDAELLTDVPGALWTSAMIEAARVKADAVPELERVVVAVDPSGARGDNDDADAIGVVVAGKAGDHVYVLSDRTLTASPAGWGRAAVEAYREFRADRIVAESNFGAGMVEHVIRTADSRVPVRLVHASRGKHVRAEPVAALYEQKRAHHVGGFPALEDELCLFSATGYTGRSSPNRADALVWAVSALMLEPDRSVTFTELRI